MYHEADAYTRAAHHLHAVYGNRKSRILEKFHTDWCYTDELLHRPVEFGYDDSAWTQVTLPHDYSIEGNFSPDNPSGSSGGFARTGVVWYRKKFNGEAYAGRKTFLVFDGVGANAEIWVNGMLAASHPYGYTPIRVDITRYLAQENVVAVKADTSLQPFSRFYQGTGLCRSVDILSTAPLHIDAYGVTYSYTGGSEVEVRTKVRVAAYADTVWHGFGKEPQVTVAKECELRTAIINAQGVIAGEAVSRHVIPEFSELSFTQKVKTDELRLWSAETPEMYFIRSELYCEGQLIDDEITPVGCRTIAYSASEGLLINGVNTKLKGVCLHQDAGFFGAAVPIKAWVKRLCLLKNMGINAVRTSHHPFPREFYDLCDSMGIYVMDEAFDEWKRGWEREISETPYGKNQYGYHQFFEQWSETDVRLMVKRDRNHPSVILWSMGNEIPDFYYADGVAELQRLVRICKEEDASRPVTIGAEGQYRLPIADGIMECLDIAGYNYITLKHPDYYDELHRLYPDRVFVSSETFYEPQHWEYIENHNYLIGQFLWVGYDYLGECRGSPINDLTRARYSVSGEGQSYGGLAEEQPEEFGFLHGWTLGMIDSTDCPKAQYYYHQSLWQTEPVIHLSAKMYEWEGQGLWWNLIPSAGIWDFADGELVTLYCFTNCDEVELFLNGEPLCNARRESMYPLEFTVKYQAGELTAVGYRNGKESCQHILRTAKAAQKLLMQCALPTLCADSADICQIDVQITDEDGYPVISNERIYFTLVGDGAIYRVGNGSNTGTEGYCGHSAETHNGRASVVITANQKGTLSLRAEAQGLAAAEILITAE